MARITIDEIYVGMPVTVSIGSDSSPYEVIGIKNKSTIFIREATPVDKGDWAEGGYTDKYKSNPQGNILEITNRGTHGWHKVGDYRSPSYGWCYRIMFGRAVHYRDPSF